MGLSSPCGRKSQPSKVNKPIETPSVVTENSKRKFLELVQRSFRSSKTIITYQSRGKAGARS